MNKDTISWIHYFYATVTASVLAYVTSMDMGDKNENESSAIDMLPNIGSNEESQEQEVFEETEVYEEPEEQEVFEEAEVYEEPQEEVYEEPSSISELPVAQPINTFSSSNGGKLKKNKTINKKNKNNKTRNRK